MDPNTDTSPTDQAVSAPTREELNAELLPVPEPPEQPEPPSPPGFEDAIAVALRHVRGKRGGDLVSILLVGSGARRAATGHSDVDLIVLVRGALDGHDIVRAGDRLIDIRYREYKTVEEEIESSPRLPPLLRKGRILYDQDGIGAKLVEKAAQRFRQGPPPAGINEQIRLKAECLHWLGKAEDVTDRPATAQYLLGIFLEDWLTAFFRLRSLWLTAPVDVLRFLASRDASLGDLVGRFLTATNLHERLNFGRQMADLLFKDVPSPARID